MIGAIRVVQRNARVWLKYMVSSMVGNLGQPLLFLLAFGLGVGRQIEMIEGYTYLQFIAPGLVASAVMYSASFEGSYGSFTRFATQSTFEGILMTPITVEELAMGEVCWGGIKGLISGVVMLAVMPLFGLVPSIWVLALIPLLLVAGVLFAALGVIMTAIAKNYEFFNYFISLVVTPLFLFSGIFFSLNELPAGIRVIFEFLPLTPVVTLSRMFCSGNFTGPWLVQIMGIVFGALGFSWVAVKLLRRRLIK